MRHAVLTLLASALLACSATRSQSVEASLGEEATLAIGATARWSPDLSVRFVAVTEDSRCPTDITCVWAGQLKIQLAISVDGKTSTHALVESEHAVIDAYRITFVSGAPAAMAERKIAPGDYRVKVRAEGAN